MQKRLAQIAQIPIIIQTTLDAVSKTFDEFLPPIDTDPEPQPSSSVEVPQISIDETEALENDPSEIDTTDEIIMEDIDDSMFEDVNKDNAKLIEFTPEPTPEPELTEQQILRLEKQIKVPPITINRNIFISTLNKFVTDGGAGKILAMGPGRKEDIQVRKQKKITIDDIQY